MRWRPHKIDLARGLYPTQHAGIVIEVIAVAMAFDLASAVLLLIEDFHVVILLPTNESLERGRELNPKYRNKKEVSSSSTREAFFRPKRR